MTNTYEPQAVEVAHKITLDSRRRLSVSGVRDVESFDEGMVVLLTVRGTLVIRGAELHLQALNLDSGTVAVDGTVDSMIYEDDSTAKGGFFARLLG